MKIVSHFCFIGLCFSCLSCVSADSLTREVGMQAYGYQEALKKEHRTTHALQADRSHLQGRLHNAEAREDALTAGGVTPAEQAELAKVRQEIRTLKKTLAKMAAAG